jgi:hypothetical protein
VPLVKASSAGLVFGGSIRLVLWGRGGGGRRVGRDAGVKQPRLNNIKRG